MTTAINKFLARAYHVYDEADPATIGPDTGEATHDVDGSLYLHQRMHLSTSESTLDLSGSSTIRAMLIVNHSAVATEIALASWASQMFSQRPAGDLEITSIGSTTEVDLITDTLSAGTFLSYGAKLGGWVTITNAEDTLNNVTALIVAAATDGNIIKLAPYSLNDSNSHDTNMKLQFLQKNVQPVAPGGQLVVTSDVRAAFDLVLQAAVGTPEVEIFIVGD